MVFVFVSGLGWRYAGQATRWFVSAFGDQATAYGERYRLVCPD